MSSSWRGASLSDAKVALFDDAMKAPAAPTTTTQEPGPLPTMAVADHGVETSNKNQLHEFMKANNCDARTALLALVAAGRAITMSNINARDVHIDAALTNFSQLYRNDDFVYSRVVNLTPVMKVSDKYFRYSKKVVYGRADAALVENGMPNEIGLAFDSEGNYSTALYGLASYVSARSMANADNPIVSENGYHGNAHELVTGRHRKTGGRCRVRRAHLPDHQLP